MKNFDGTDLGRTDLVVVSPDSNMSTLMAKIKIKCGNNHPIQTVGDSMINLNHNNDVVHVGRKASTLDFTVDELIGFVQNPVIVSLSTFYYVYCVLYIL